MKKILLLLLCFLFLNGSHIFGQEEPAEEAPANNIINSVSENSEKNEISEKKIEYKKLTLDGSDRPEVEKFRKIYLEEKKQKELKRNLEDAIDYRLFVRKAIRDRELPEELEYLPIVESNYKTHARSKSGAVGIWQFMANSVKPFLVLNDYVDERLDPWKATDAALKKLTDNYKYFNDWLLALAAYNCGAGALSRALAKSPEKNFWALCEKNLIPEQTKLYVPKLLAIADIAINSEWYEADIPSHEEEFLTLYNERNGVFDYLSVTKAYSISQLANKMRIDESLMKELNPSFVLGYTHPSLESKIRLPAGTLEAANQAIASLSPISFPVKYKVVKGDSLWTISRRYKVSIDSICELNGIKENDILRIGKILYIPSK
ncbi:MAG: transglycosylase SLT domain-containing protein [Treponema sp.]|nr:transglycosylase SLT domain-containing protein [Treponema sp.]